MGVYKAKLDLHPRPGAGGRWTGSEWRSQPCMPAQWISFRFDSCLHPPRLLYLASHRILEGLSTMALLSCSFWLFYDITQFPSLQLNQLPDLTLHIRPESSWVICRNGASSTFCCHSAMDLNRLSAARPVEQLFHGTVMTTAPSAGIIPVFVPVANLQCCYSSLPKCYTVRITKEHGLNNQWWKWFYPELYWSHPMWRPRRASPLVPPSKTK